MTALLLAWAALQDDAPRKMTVDLPANGSLVMAGDAVAWKDVVSAFRKFRESGIRTVVVRADGSVPFSSVARVMEAAREAGLDNVEISTEKPASPPKFADPAPAALRIKIKEGAKGLELRVLLESGAGSLDSLKETLRTIEKMPVVIDVEDGVSYDIVQQVAKACTDAGFEKVTFASPTKKADPIRVLLADRLPRYEFRFLRSALQRNSGIALDLFLASADEDFPGYLKEFPTDLTHYDVVVLGPLSDLDETRRKALVEFVQRGGGLVWMGPGDSKEWIGEKLDAICPVQISKIEIAPVSLEAKDPEHPILKGWKLPESKANSGWRTDKIDSSATILLDPGFLVVQPVGQGRVAYVGSDDTWRWRYLVGDQPHFSPFWMRVIEWTAGRRK